MKTPFEIMPRYLTCNKIISNLCIIKSKIVSFLEYPETLKEDFSITNLLN